MKEGGGCQYESVSFCSQVNDLGPDQIILKDEILLTLMSRQWRHWNRQVIMQ